MFTLLVQNHLSIISGFAAKVLVNHAHSLLTSAISPARVSAHSVYACRRNRPLEKHEAIPHVCSSLSFIESYDLSETVGVSYPILRLHGLIPAIAFVFFPRHMQTRTSISPICLIRSTQVRSR